MLKKSLIIFFVVISIFFAFSANAQLQNGDIVFQINPKYPKVNDSVTASLSTYTTDLNNTKISWILNGETMTEGIGKTSYFFRVGNSGFQTNIEAKIQTINGNVVTKKISISPSNIDMLWEAYDTYTPPFYKGKTLASSEGSIKVVAIPSTKNLTGYNYKWKQDDKNDLAASGYEKNYYVYTNSFLEDKNTVEVSVMDLLGNGIGLGKITITPGSPKIVFYKKDQIMGTKWEESLSDGFYINKNGEIIVAEPYFFSKRDLNSSFYKFDWYLNGEQITTPNQKNILPVKLASDKTGSSLIKVIINNNKTLFQSIGKTINVNF
jgi:hypothetical protein